MLPGRAIESGIHVLQRSGKSWCSSNSSPNAVQLGNRALDKGQCVPNNLCLLYLIEANVFFWRATTSRGNGAYNETGSYNRTKEPSALPSFVVWSQEPKARAPPTTPRAGDGAFFIGQKYTHACVSSRRMILHLRWAGRITGRENRLLHSTIESFVKAGYGDCCSSSV